MASIDKALPWILAHEGGWSDDPDDPGGATNQGITLETSKRHGIMTKESLRDITPEQVAGIYKADYWRFDAISSQQVATKIFDMAVNMGLKTAITLAQKALVTLGAPDDFVDGRFGKWTTRSINAVAPAEMLALLCEESADRYLSIVINRPKSAKYLGGWLKRAEAIPCE